MTIKAVVDLGFGDSGKGVVTNWLANKDSCVFRYSGGHQAGHTVVHNGKRHVFSNFGSGTLKGATTYWSKYCTVDPVGLYNEHQILKDLGYSPEIYIDNECPITTPFEKMTNRLNPATVEHGTCGVGFGQTIQREEDFYHLQIGDLAFTEIFNKKFELIVDYYQKKNIFVTDSAIDEFITCCNYIIVNLPKPDLDFNYEHLIFEGSQGLLLDQHFGFFPHVTRSNTGTKNIIEMCNDLHKTDDSEIYLVTRCYQTRHGNGPMTNEHLELDMVDGIIETNSTNKYQGEFRKTVLDLDLLLYGMMKDIGISKFKSKNLVVTCLEHLNKYKFTFNNKLYEYDNEIDFINAVDDIVETYAYKCNIFTCSNHNVKKFK
jgi:adenylosuccinate synthase